jgi:hypothetical protein
VEITYPVNTLLQTEAIKTAINLAKASGYKTAHVIRAKQTGSSSWDVTLVVM